MKEIDPSVPEADDLVTSQDGKAIVDVVRSQAALLRTTAGPPGIPADRLAVLREAYMTALRDPELLADAKKFDIPIVPMDGETLAKRIDQALQKPPAVVALLAQVTSQEGKTVDVSSELSAVEDGGKVIRIAGADGPMAVAISGSRTVVTIGEKPADRAQLVAGMKCDINYTPGGENEAVSVTCSAP
jgi:hypothetical protein